jgi:hypothetical protein
MSDATGPKISEADLIRQAFNARLVIFLSTHDPSRLVEVESLVSVFAGREHQLLKDLCEKYKVDGGAELQAFEKQLNDLRPTHATNKRGSVKITDTSMIDPLTLQDLSREERKRFEAQLEEETTAMRKKYEAQLEEEKASYIQSISEKEGTIAKLKSQIESLDRGKNSTEVRFVTALRVNLLACTLEISYTVHMWLLFCCAGGYQVNAGEAQHDAAVRRPGHDTAAGRARGGAEGMPRAEGGAGGAAADAQLREGEAAQPRSDHEQPHSRQRGAHRAGASGG